MVGPSMPGMMPGTAGSTRVWSVQVRNSEVFARWGMVRFGGQGSKTVRGCPIKENRTALQEIRAVRPTPKHNNMSLHKVITRSKLKCMSNTPSNATLPFPNTTGGAPPMPSGPLTGLTKAGRAELNSWLDGLGQLLVLIYNYSEEDSKARGEAMVALQIWGKLKEFTERRN